MKTEDDGDNDDNNDISDSNNDAYQSSLFPQWHRREEQLRKVKNNEYGENQVEGRNKSQRKRGEKGE